MVQTKNRLEKCLYHHSEWNLTASNFLNYCVLNMTRISTSVLFTPYSKLYILTKLSPKDVKFISSDRQELDLSNIYSNGTVNSIFVEIQPDSTNIKNDPRISYISNRISYYMYKRIIKRPNIIHFLTSRR